MTQSMVQGRSFDKVEAFYNLMGLAGQLGGQVPEAVHAGVEGSDAYIAAQLSEIASIDEQIKSAQTVEERQVLWARRDAACKAIDTKDVQNKAYGLKVVTVLSVTVGALAGGALWLVRRAA